MTDRFVSPVRSFLVLAAAALLAFAILALSPRTFCASEEFPVVSPPLTPGIFPCSSCHASMRPNTTRRELSMHDEIKLRHAPEALPWCLACHDAGNRDKLRLVNGNLIDFTQTYLLCGQCHGTNYRDWKAGIHGKRIGYFSGRAEECTFSA